MTGDEVAAPAPATGQPLRLFYGTVVDEAELRSAMDLEGIDQEVALLRVKLREHLDAHSDDYALFMKSVESIVKAVALRYRISDKRTKDLASALSATLDAVSGGFLDA